MGAGELSTGVRMGVAVFAPWWCHRRMDLSPTPVPPLESVGSPFASGEWPAQAVHPDLRPVQALRAEGWTTHDVRRAVREERLVRLARGIYVPVAEITPREQHLRQAAAFVAGRAAAVLSHESAAVAHGLALPIAAPESVHLTLAPPATRRRRTSLHVHVAPLEAHDVVEIRGLRVTSLARTAFDLACTLPYPWAVIVADQCLGRRVPRPELWQQADGAGQRSGIRQARAVIAFADGRSQSPAESASRVSMARAGIPAPELQAEIIAPHGWVASTDFAWRGHRLVGEVDGKTKYTDLLRDGETAGDAVLADKRREEDIRQAGWWITRWGWTEAWDPARLARLIRGAMAQASDHHTVVHPR